MLVTFPNDVKIYNLSAGKSLPEWLSDRKRRKLLQDDVDLQRRIELIQDFDMPDCSNCITMSKDAQFVYVAGTYKPRIKCYDVNNLSMKFERCLDSEPIKTLVLSEGYEKIILLEEDRWLEFHVQYGHYFRLRIPKFGRDISYHEPSADLYIVGSGPDAYRVNLEQGRFMTPFATSATSLTKCDVNPEHHLMIFGTWEGKVEAWDPRVKSCVGILDPTLNLSSETNLKEIPSVSCLKFKDGLHMAVGTSTGQILLYDIRSNRPYLIKDHRCDLPIRSLDFCRDMDLIMSMDSRVVKLWSESDDGKPYTSIEPGVDLNDLHLIRGSGLFFIANEGQKILTYYIPSLGPAPKWCSFLDNITEELEETDQPDVYDDYKFLTSNELEELGLSHLIGSKMLRAYMHGYFVDARLYNKAKSMVNPFAYQEYRKSKIREQIDKERSNRVLVKKLPQVNRQLAERLLTDEMSAVDEETKEKVARTLAAKKKAKKQKAVAKSLLHDDRFKALFENPEYEIEPDNEEFQLLNPALVRLGKQKKKQNVVESDANASDEDEKEMENDGKEGSPQGQSSDDEDLYARASTSSEDDQDYVNNMKQNYKEITRRRQERAKAERTAERFKRPKVFEIQSADDFQGWGKELANTNNSTDKAVSLGVRLDNAKKSEEIQTISGKEITYSVQKSFKQEERERKIAEHVRERRKTRRSAFSLKSKGNRFK